MQKSFNLVKVFFAVIIIVSTTFILASALTYHNASTSDITMSRTKIVYGEGIIIKFSAHERPYLTAGEKATFDVEIMHFYKSPIYQVDFSLNYKALSLYGLNIISTKHHLARELAPGVSERIALVEIIPQFLTPGFYELGLKVKGNFLETPLELNLVIYIERSTPVLIVSSTLLALSCIFFALSILGDKVDTKISSNLGLRRLAFLGKRINRKSTIVDTAIKNYAVAHAGSYTVGQRFIVVGIFALFVTSFLMILNFENLTNDFAILAYFSLAIGVLNMFFEITVKKYLVRFGVFWRFLLSSIILELLLFFSNNPLSYAVLLLIFYLVIRISLEKLDHGKLAR